jgi:hypothetical protein
VKFSIKGIRITNSTISGNMANLGAGVFVSGVGGVIKRSTISGNTSADINNMGGGSFVQGGTLEIGDSTISGNAVTQSGPPAAGSRI